MTRTAFYWHESCFWHGGGNYAQMLPVGGMVQPMATGGLPENPETKRRLKNLLEVSGLAGELNMLTAEPATLADLQRVHTSAYLDEFKAMSDAGGGELGLRTPFSAGGFEQASMSAGLTVAALRSVLTGEHANAYALSRPPGHHCLPDWPNGFCLLANIAIAIESAREQGLARRFAVVDWDVHHGNGTEQIFYERDDVLTISLHQDRCYPRDTGAVSDTGRGAGEGFNVNIPLPPGGGHATYLEAMQTLVLPRIRAFQPDVIMVASGYDASAVDPLSRMLCHGHTYGEMTDMLLDLAGELCNGRLVMAHEGGYSELHVPFCGHEVLARMADSAIRLEDPLQDRIEAQQPSTEWQKHFSALLASYRDVLGVG